MAFLLSNLCCHDGVLPQGSPTSPLLTNIICQRLDRKLSQFGKANRAVYTRYADDISFSSNQPVFSDSFINQVKEILVTEGFAVNSAKTRLQHHRQRQVVTGIKVNEKLNVDRTLIRTIRAILHNAKRSWDFAQDEFDRAWDKSKGPVPNFISSVRGQIEFIGMVRGKDDITYQKYRKQFREMFEDLHDYTFITNEKVRHQLIRDWDKMKKVKADPGIPEDDRFTEYCITAFLQIEELINYYCSTAMPFDTLLSELNKHTYLDKSRSKDKTNVSQIDMVYKTFLFEKYFFYKKGVYYESIINKIRLVRNQGLHRCSVIIKDEQSIRIRYRELQDKINAYRLKHAGEYSMSNRERHLEYEIKLIPFLKERDYAIVKQAVMDVAAQVKQNVKS
jgi:RNA-directed DNA polymerase